MVCVAVVPPRRFEATARVKQARARRGWVSTWCSAVTNVTGGGHRGATEATTTAYLAEQNKLRCAATPPFSQMAHFKLVPPTAALDQYVGSYVVPRGHCSHWHSCRLGPRDQRKVNLCGFTSMCFCRVKLSAVPPFKYKKAYGVNSQPWIGRSVRHVSAKTMSPRSPPLMLLLTALVD